KERELEAETPPLRGGQVAGVVPPFRAEVGMRAVVLGKREGPYLGGSRIALGASPKGVGDGNRRAGRLASLAGSPQGDGRSQQHRHTAEQDQEAGHGRNTPICIDGPVPGSNRGWAVLGARGVVCSGAAAAGSNRRWPGFGARGFIRLGG